jgi:hypothetical protein
VNPLTKLTYANVVSTLALILAVGGGAAYAASKINSNDIAPGAVKTNKIFKRAVVSGKIAVGAVRTNQIADGAISSAQIHPGSVAPSDLQFPVQFVASPTGGSAPIGEEPVAYPLSNASWTQSHGQIMVVFGGATATLAYDGSGSGQCQVFFELSLSGRQLGGGEISTSSTTMETAEASLGLQPDIDPPEGTVHQHVMTARISSNGDCVAGSMVDSSRFRVLDFG